MKQKKGIYTIVLLISIGLWGLRAQTVLNVKELSGTQTTFALSSIKKLTFSSGNITVNKNDGNIANFATQNVRYLNFTDITAVNEIKSEENYLLLYPNPVINKLQVCIAAVNCKNIYLQIMNIQGKVVYQQLLTIQNGSNYINIPFDTYQSGMYLCQIQINNTIETKKFIKY